MEISRTLRNKVVVWLSQMARGIKEWQKTEEREKIKQLQFF